MHTSSARVAHCFLCLSQVPLSCRRREAAKPKPRRDRARPERPVSLPDIHSREQQTKQTERDADGLHERLTSQRPGEASPVLHMDSARVLGQTDAVKAVLEGTVRSGGNRGRVSVDGSRKARETHASHYEAKVRPLGKEARKQHTRDRRMDGEALQRRKVSAFAPAASVRSQSQSTFRTLDTGVFFASVSTGTSPERQGYEERLRNF